jgi:type II secretory pathway pseudopilin PulG
MAVNRDRIRLQAAGSRPGLTLLELLIILSVVAILIFIALPTLQPTEVEATADFAKQQLEYLHNQEQTYFSIHGNYAPLSTLANDERLGPTFDQRFAFDESLVNNVVFSGPTGEERTYTIVAELPDGSRYKIDQSGAVTPLQ